jgi:hypothetical protein
MSQMRDFTERNQRILALRKSGLGQSAIAASLGLSRGTVIGVLDRFKSQGAMADVAPLPTHPNFAAKPAKERADSAPRTSWTPSPEIAARNEQVIALRMQGIAPAAISERLGLSPQTTYNILAAARADGKLAGEKPLPGRNASPSPVKRESEGHAAPKPRFVLRDPCRDKAHRVDPAPLPAEPPIAGAQTLDQVQESGCCRWPTGTPRTANFGFCGQPRASADAFMADPMPYCRHHRAMARSRQQSRSIPGGVAW